MTSDAKITALLAEDEAPLARDLSSRLQRAWPELQLIGVAENGVQALELAEAHEPDIVFLDIKMPGLSGLDVARQLSYRPHVVFVTAYSEHAVEAFEREAVDYLLKPVQDQRLAQTVERLRSRTEKQTPPANLENVLNSLLQRLPGGNPYLQWVRAGVGNTIHNIAVEDVLYFQSEDKYTRVATRQLESLVRTSLAELETQLDPNRFQRVHRGTIVNLRAIKSIRRNDLGNLELVIDGRDELLAVSRAHAGAFRQM